MGIKKIEDATFYGCKKLEKLVIPNGVKELGVCSFYGCTELKELVIPDSMKIIGAAAFKNTHANVTVKVPKKKLKAYKTMLLKKGVSKKSKISKI